MKIELVIETQPHSFEMEDEIVRILKDEDKHRGLETAIELAIKELMDWENVDVEARACVLTLVRDYAEVEKGQMRWSNKKKLRC